MENMFEGVKFGDKYKARNGLCAVFYQRTSSWYALFYENGEMHCVMSDGHIHDLSCFVNPEDYLTENDIIGKWEEPIDEKHLEKLAGDFCEEVDDYRTSVGDTDDYDNIKYYPGDIYDAYLAGYRQAKGEM